MADSEQKPPFMSHMVPHSGKEAMLSPSSHAPSSVLHPLSIGRGGLPQLAVPGLPGSAFCTCAHLACQKLQQEAAWMYLLVFSL